MLHSGYIGFSPVRDGFGTARSAVHTYPRAPRPSELGSKLIMGTYFTRIALAAVLACALVPLGNAGAQTAGKPMASPPPVAGSPAAKPAPGDPQIQIGRDLVTVNVTVMDPYGRFVTGLEKSSFE